LSEVVEVSGELGNFTVKVKHNPRYIDMDKCIACGLCAQKCPRKVDDEFNQGLNQRKSAYIKYAQSIPLKYVIDGETCIYLTRGKCKACEKFCPTSAINFDDKADIATLNVGAVILSPGFKPFDPKGFDFYGYGTIPDVVTSMEYERLLSSSGPCMGHLTRPSDSKEPRRIAWIQCVGSRNTNRCANGYCSSVCCMYAIKEALVTAEHTSGGGLEQTIFFMDIRSHGKDFDRFYEGAKAKGVRFVRARPHSIEPGSGNSGVVMRYTTEDGRTRVEEFDLAVLSIGLEPPADAQQLADMFKLNLDHYRFAQTSDLAPGCTNQPGVYVAGAFQAPKVIQRSVTEASSAAAEAATALIQSRGELTRRKTYPAERSVAGDETRIGVFVCSCGINIAGVINVDEVTKYARSLPHVVLAENNLFSCSADTQELMAKKISEHRLNRVVIAACTPRTHEPLFQDTLRETGLNPYLVEMANIRNQNAWVHQREPEQATDKAKDQVRMAVAKTALSVPLESGRVNVVPTALVIGGGVAGMAAAMSLADQSFQTVLLEKSDRLGGNAWKVNTTDQGEAIRPYLESLIQKVEQHPNIKVLKNAQLKTAVGSVGSFVSEIQVNGDPRAVTYGVAVLATGGRESRPDEYLYGEDPRVVTHLEFDALLRDQPAELRKAQSVAFIQCVGSRDERRPYCSRVCCTHSVKAALSLKGLNPQMNVYVLYRDMRTYGAREDLYRKARDLGVIFIRYDLDRKPVVRRDGADLTIDVFDPILQMPVTIAADRLVLAAAVEANETRELVELYKCAINADGFLNEAHPKLRPVDMSVDGLFVAGLCNYPKPLNETIAQAKAAAARAASILSQTEMTLDAIKSFVTDKCDGCALCLDVCPYRAIKLEDYAGGDGRGHRRIATDPALCKGCGLCAATCPKGGVYVHGFTLDQLKAQVAAALEDVA
jgi:heterodisulfide reductase subunit A